MTVRNARSHPRRLALCLALLALFAQLWMAQVSTGHLARMLSAQAAWGEICTSAGVPHVGDVALDTGHDDPATAAFHCPVCGAAAASLAPPPADAPPKALPAWTQQRIPLALAPVREARRAGLRPPAQAPPAA